MSISSRGVALIRSIVGTIVSSTLIKGMPPHYGKV
jgi:hypothetical protein